ncbi:MAG: DUF3795 domain-containing protein [Anaerolineae bacterium]|nr:DUF3795 domain-containing protein [Anaerolineae bacterium]
MAYPIKALPTIGCCGIDCGLCPRYHTAGSSRCPGCCGENFSSQHPACGIATCCLKKKGVEVCGQCADFPCARLNNWDVADSFVTHRVSLSNLWFIRENGLDVFITSHRKRIALLEVMLSQYDDGRSKGLYCLAAALLPLPRLEVAVDEVARRISAIGDTKVNASLLRQLLNDYAAKEGIELRLRRT